MALLRSPWWRDPAILTLLLLLAPTFLGEYQISSLALFIPYAMAASALAFVWGYCGILALGQATFFGIGGYAIAKMVSVTGPKSGIIYGLIIGLLISAAVAWLISRFSFGFKVDVFVISVTTFCMTLAFEKLAIKFSEFTGGENGIPVNPILPTETLPNYFIVVTIFILVLFGLVTISRSDFGRTVLAVKIDESRLRHLGVNVNQIKRQVFILGALVTCFAGGLDALTSGIAATNKVGFEFSTLILLWCAIGGRTSLSLAALGTLIINMVSNQLGDILANYWQLILAAIFVLIVMYFPEGLYSMFRGIGRKIDRHTSCQIISVQDPENKAGILTAYAGKNIYQKFGDFVALDIEEIGFPSGQVSAIIGPNGAGKTTFISYISGGLRKAKGSSQILDKPINGEFDYQIARLGVKRKFQSPSIFDQLSIEDNLVLGANAPLSFPKSWVKRNQRLELPPKVIDLARENGLLDMWSKSAGELAHGSKQFLEVCMVLASSPKLILLDEPTAGLVQEDRYKIGRVIKALANAGVTILIVEHDFDFVRFISDRIYVLHQGSLITSGTPDEISVNARVRELYLGADS